MSTLTRAVAEASAVSGVGTSLLETAGMATTTEGEADPNPDLDSPLLRALEHFQVAAGDPANISDADLARVPSAAVVRFLEYLRIMVVEALAIRLASQPSSIEWDDFKERSDPAKVVAALLETLWANYRRRYLQSGGPKAGVMCDRSANGLDARPYFPPYPRPAGRGT